MARQRLAPEQKLRPTVKVIGGPVYTVNVTAVGPDSDCAIATLLKFLNRVTGGDAELAAFLQRITGYGLTSSTQSTHCSSTMVSADTSSSV